MRECAIYLFILRIDNFNEATVDKKCISCWVSESEVGHFIKKQGDFDIWVYGFFSISFLGTC